MSTELNNEILQNWKTAGYHLVVAEELTGKSDSNPVEFIIYPFKTVSETEVFLLHKTRGVPYPLQQEVICYNIESTEMQEIAEGVFFCKFYIGPDTAQAA